MTKDTKVLEFQAQTRPKPQIQHSQKHLKEKKKVYVIQSETQVFLPSTFRGKGLFFLTQSVILLAMIMILRNYPGYSPAAAYLGKIACGHEQGL